MSLTIDNGLEVWLGNYLEDKTVCRRDEAEHKLGEKLAKKLTARLADLGHSIRTIIESSYRSTSAPISTYKFVSDGIGDPEVTYNKTYGYLVFPTYISTTDTSFCIKIRINPCIGQGTTKTKIYCNTSNTKTISSSDITANTNGMLEIAKQTMQFVVSIYVEELTKDSKNFDSYLLTNGLKGRDVISIGFSIKDNSATRFITELQNKDAFYAHLARDENAREITNTIYSISSQLDIDSKPALNDFKWVVAKLPNNDGMSDTTPTTTYIGNGNTPTSSIFISFSAGSPNKVLHDLNVDLVNANR